LHAVRVSKTVRILDSVINTSILILVLLTIAFAIYAIWDSEQIYRAADKSNYTIYKPDPDNKGKTFSELQAINADVIAWLNVYGTDIDYPVTQGDDNMEYVNKNAEGLYSLSGSIFLDSDNKRDFSDFINILYGHHMEKHAMFGDIGNFADRNVFESHNYGNLFFEGKDHGIEFFAFIHASAYNTVIFTPDIDKEEEKQIYLDGLLKNAIYKKDIGVTTEDHIILLSTCSSGSTNGRDILIGKITEEVYENPFLTNGN
jgi:sortase B